MFTNGGRPFHYSRKPVRISATTWRHAKGRFNKKARPIPESIGSPYPHSIPVTKRAIVRTWNLPYISGVHYQGKSDDPQVNDDVSSYRQDLILTKATRRIRNETKLPPGQRDKRPLIVVLTKYDAWARRPGDRLRICHAK